VALHGAETIAAVIVEPVAGSTGVLMPPKGYLERLRAITRKHGILLIFDEVITGFGRLGSAFAAEHFDVMPDMICCAKGITNGVIPMGAVITTAEIHDAFMTGPEHLIELFHGYTYSGSPIASAAGLATLETYAEEGLFQRAAEMAPYWEDGLHSLRDCPHVIDIRNMGLIGAVELEPIAGEPTKRAFSAFLKAFEKGVIDPHDGRHHRHVAAADHREGAYRPAFRDAAGCAEGCTEAGGAEWAMDSWNGFGTRPA
jgi:beta-alanine--pyruvate transaminase